MGITIGRADAERKFQLALRLARDVGALPAEWLERTSTVARAQSKTYTAVLGTILLAKATNRHIDAFALREDESHRSYSARSVAKDVFVPCCIKAGIDIRTTGAEPFNNQPFLRATRITENLKVRTGGEGDLKYLCKCLEQADFLEDEAATNALAAFLRSRIEATGSLGQVGVDGHPLPTRNLIDAIDEFVAGHVAGGAVGQALTAAVLDLHFKDVRTRKVNDPGRRWSGDVGVFVDDALSIGVEVKQRSFTESEVLQFIERLARDGTARGVVVALGGDQVPLDLARLSSRALGTAGCVLVFALGMRDLVERVISMSLANGNESLQLLPIRGLVRLKELEVNESIQRAWVAATTQT